MNFGWNILSESFLLSCQGETCSFSCQGEKCPEPDSYFLLGQTGWRWLELDLKAVRTDNYTWPGLEKIRDPDPRKFCYLSERFEEITMIFSQKLSADMLSEVSGRPFSIGTEQSDNSWGQKTCLEPGSRLSLDPMSYPTEKEIGP